MLSLAAVIPVTGWAARRFGAKRVYLVSLVLFTVGSALCGLATSSTELIVFRVLQGVGGGMILPIGQLMMAEAAGPKRMGRVMSIVAVPAMLAPILGPTIGGLIIDNASWRWIFYVNLPIGIIAVIAGAADPAATSQRAADRRARRPRARADGHRPAAADLRSGRRSAITGSFTAPKVILPLPRRASRWSSAFAWHALHVDATRCSTCASTGGRRSPPPRSRCSASAPRCSAAMILLPLYWQDIRHESVVDTGLLTAPQGLGMALVMPLAGKLTDRFGGGPLALFGVIVTTITTIPFGLIGAHTSIAWLSVAMLLARHRHRLRVHAGDDGGVRVARALRARPTRRRS